jgi:hypothetical protein
MPQQIEVVPYSEIRKELRGLCNKSDTDKIAAKKLKVTQSTLSLTLRGKANVVPEKILKALKLKTELVYVRTGKPKAVAPVVPTSVTLPEGMELADPKTGLVKTKAPTIDEVSGVKPDPYLEGITARADRTVREITEAPAIDVSGRDGEVIDVTGRG